MLIYSIEDFESKLAERNSDKIRALFCPYNYNFFQYFRNHFSKSVMQKPFEKYYFTQTMRRIIIRTLCTVKPTNPYYLEDEKDEFYDTVKETLSLNIRRTLWTSFDVEQAVADQLGIVKKYNNDAHANLASAGFDAFLWGVGGKIGELFQSERTTLLFAVGENKLIEGSLPGVVQSLTESATASKIESKTKGTSTDLFDTGSTGGNLALSLLEANPYIKGGKTLVNIAFKLYVAWDSRRLAKDAKNAARNTLIRAVGPQAESIGDDLAYVIFKMHTEDIKGLVEEASRHKYEESEQYWRVK